LARSLASKPDGEQHYQALEWSVMQGTDGDFTSAALRSAGSPDEIR
jgi:hypothetical protein